MATILTGCATSGSIKFPEPTYPELPADLRVCFENVVPAPAKGPMTKGQVIRLIATLKQSEAEKSECGKRLIAFYDSLSK